MKIKWKRIIGNRQLLELHINGRVAGDVRALSFNTYDVFIYTWLSSDKLDCESQKYPSIREAMREIRKVTRILYIGRGYEV